MTSPPPSRERLQHAALRLFADRGFDGTTVADIAAEAGLTERTFFRHFTDKREALFTPQAEFDALFLAGLDGHPGRDPRALTETALTTAAAAFPGTRREWCRARQRVIDADVRFQERELLKLVTVARALTTALVNRGIEPIQARMAAETAGAAFRVAFELWVDRDDERTLADTVREVLAEFDQLIAG
ncbi:TetR family transcriptional regulator [Nocardia higoensis]|uniref:TetR family transcriptional regulator n=1 Tax=Nocardia higoensis TaxID=228599 RepID=UPI0002DF8E0E|nr:TetR family transcriptional regulator [Nocardia higoensis]